jgi:hypothetical protein
MGDAEVVVGDVVDAEGLGPREVSAVAAALGLGSI